MGPARALEERERFKNNSHFVIFLYVTHSSQKSSSSDLYIAFFDVFFVFFRFLAEIRFRTIMKLPPKASSRNKPCSFGTSVTLPSF